MNYNENMTTNLINHNKSHLPKGSVLSQRYEITDILGEGGFSITYKAIHTVMKKPVAIKEYFNRDYLYRDTRISEDVQLYDPVNEAILQRDIDRFVSEARILSKFSEVRGIVHVTDFFLENKTAYMVMDIIEGVSLETLLQQGVRFPWDDISRKMLPLMESLSMVHKEGIIHRDIKPGNIIVAEDGSLTLIDFGAALPYQSENTHSVYLSEGYAPKEQYLSKGKLGPYTDIYSLCAVMYHCITGTIPEASLQRAVLDELMPLSAMNLKIPVSFENVLMKGLQIEPDDRWQDINELHHELTSLLPSSKKPNKILFAFLGIASFITVLALILCLTHIPELKVRYYVTRGKATSFRLSAPSSMTANDFTKTIGLIEERADSLAGKHNYLIDEGVSDVLITIPDKYMSETEDWSKKDILHILFAFSGNWLMHNPDMTQYFTLTSDNINMVTLNYGHLPVKTQSGDPSFYFEPIDWASEEEGYYLEFELDEEASNFLNDELKDAGYLFLVSAHFEAELNSSGYFFDWIAKGDGKTLYFPLGQVGTQNIAETMKLIFSIKGYRNGLKLKENCSTHLKSNIKKEKKTDSVFSEPTVEIDCTVDSKKDHDNALQFCKSQLELLDIPNEVIDDSSSITVKLPISKANNLIINFLFGADAYIETLWGETCYYFFSQTEAKQIEIQEADDGIDLNISFSSDLKELFSSDMIDLSPGQLVINVNGIRVGLLKSINPEHKMLTFHLLFPENGDTSSISVSVMANFIKSIISSDYTFTLTEKNIRWYDKDGMELSGDELPDIDTGLDTERFSDLFDDVEKLGGTAKHSIDSFDENITLEFEHWNGNFPIDALAMIESLYTEHNIDKNICPSVRFIINSWYQGKAVRIQVHFVDEAKSKSVIPISGVVTSKDKAALNTAKEYIEKSSILNADKNRQMYEDSLGGYYEHTDWSYVENEYID